MTVAFTGKQSDFLKIGVAAAGRGDLAKVKEILAAKPDWLHRRGSHGRTMLWEAAYKGKLPVVEHLVSEGADIHLWGCHFTPHLTEISPYCAAQIKQHDSTASFLRAKGASIDVFTVAYQGSNDLVRKLLSNDSTLIDQEVDDRHSVEKHTLLHYAIAGRNRELAEELINQGAPIEPYSEQLIRFTVWRELASVLDLLLANGTKIDSADFPRGGVRSEAIEKVLEKHGVEVDPNLIEGGWPPLAYICRGDRGGNVERVKELLAAGADPNLPNYKGQTALHCAAKAGFTWLIPILIEAGARVDPLDKANLTPLGTAVRSSIKDIQAITEVVQMLLDAGADLDAHNGTKATPRTLIERRRASGKLGSVRVT